MCQCRWIAIAACFPWMLAGRKLKGMNSSTSRRLGPGPSLWLAFLLVTLVPGCGGCSDDAQLTPEEREAKREELKDKAKKKVDYEFLSLASLPGTQDRKEVRVKPGHWVSAHLEARANNGDFRGELESSMLANDSRTVSLDGQPFELIATRPAIMAKGQNRIMEFPIYVPRTSNASQLATSLLTGEGGRELLAERDPVVRMPAHQFYLVVLASSPDKYSYMSELDCVLFPGATLTEEDIETHYRVVAPRVEKLAPLPASVLAWTCVAYVVWDDFDPKLLSAPQQQALVDWLHWGGQLIVSGPDSLDTLRGSFLEPYLPVTSGGTWQIGPETVAGLNDRWTRNDRKLEAVGPWTAVKLNPTSPRTEVLDRLGEDPLVIDAAVGHGRVAVSALRLSQASLYTWSGFDGWFHTCFLKRQPRKFVDPETGTYRVEWQNGSRYDARLVSDVRFFSRDAPAPSALFSPAYFAFLGDREKKAREEMVDQTGFLNPTSGAMRWDVTNGQVQFAEATPLIGPGVASWDDFSAAAEMSRQTLQDSAGIKVPKANFVLAILGVYVGLLVPVNWLFFRLLGRVEWAWGAAPLIAIGGAAFVTYAAQLDIGFARSQTEVAVLEIQASYPRAHLSRYMALYSSLGTSYGLEFADPGAIGLPFPRTSDRGSVGDKDLVEFRRAREVTQADDEDATEDVSMAALRSVEFPSNTTGMVHSEEMVDLGGTLSAKLLDVDRYEIENKTLLAFENAVVVLGAAQGLTPKGAWIGSLGPGAAVTVNLAPIRAQRRSSSQSSADTTENGESEQQAATDVLDQSRGGRRAKRPTQSKREATATAKDSRELEAEGEGSTNDEFNIALVVRPGAEQSAPTPGELDLRRLVELAQLTCEDGELRLVAECREQFAGVTVRPTISQTRSAAMVVAHLALPRREVPERDVNAAPFIKPLLEEFEE